MPLESIYLADPTSGATAKILPGYGFNCYSFQTMHGGQPVEALWSAADFESGREKASHSGIPILFPFPGRIGGGAFEFEGKTYQLDAGDGRGNAIHGFALNRAWEVVERAADRVSGRFQASKVDPALLRHWPGDFVLTCVYTLRGNCLRSEFTVENPGPGPLPFGLGTHAYFRLPLGPAGDAAQCVVSVPVRESWELADMLPTGKRIAGPIHQRLRAGMPFGETQFDDVFTGLGFAGGVTGAAIDDLANNRRLSIEFPTAFGECVVYNPPHRQAICIEPYTCLPDPFRMTAAGVDAGLRVLKPGETWQTWVEIRVD